MRASAFSMVRRSGGIRCSPEAAPSSSVEVVETYANTGARTTVGWTKLGPTALHFDRSPPGGFNPRVSTDDKDRRGGDRAPIELKVEYKRLNSFFADYTKNISRGGTFIRTDRPLGIGTEFNFKLCVPTLENPLVLRGKVQWTVIPEEVVDDGEPGMGIGFVYGSESERERIEAIVETLMVDSLGNVIYEKLMGKPPRGSLLPGK